MIVICITLDDGADVRFSGIFVPLSYTGINLEAEIATCEMSRPGGRVYNDFGKYRPYVSKLITVVLIEGIFTCSLLRIVTNNKKISIITYIGFPASKP
jgi:hypothetical protein